MVDSLKYDWCNKGCRICYPVCRMVHIKEPLLLIGKSSPCGSNRFSLSLSEWSFTMNNVLSVSLNKTFPSFLPYLNNQTINGVDSIFLLESGFMV